MPKNRKVLVVDDNPINLTVLQEILEDQFRVQFAKNGREAMRMAVEFQPGFILLDVMMPGMDGLEVCRQLRTTDGVKDSVIVMVSAKAMPSERAAGICAGANDYITKPFDEVELLRLLRRHAAAPPRETERRAWDESNDEVSVV